MSCFCPKAENIEVATKCFSLSKRTARTRYCCRPSTTRATWPGATCSTCGPLPKRRGGLSASGEPTARPAASFWSASALPSTGSCVGLSVGMDRLSPQRSPDGSTWLSRTLAAAKGCPLSRQSRPLTYRPSTNRGRGWARPRPPCRWSPATWGCSSTPGTYVVHIVSILCILMPQNYVKFALFKSLAFLTIWHLSLIFIIVNGKLLGADSSFIKEDDVLFKTHRWIL